MSKCIVAGIVTYNPTIDRLNKNINSVIGQVDRVIIVDNGSENYSDIDKLCSKYNDKIYIIRNEQNQGIAVALNQILSFAIDNRYEWFLTLDQDSIIFNHLISRYQSININNHVAIISSPYIDDNKIDFGCKANNIEDSAIHLSKYCITSGSLCRTDVIRKIGGFNEKLFIDCVDADLCIRLNNAGYQIFTLNNPGFIHELGKSTSFKLLNRQITVFNEKPIRHYYMARNLLYLYSTYHLNEALKNYFIYIGKILFFESNKRRKIRAYFWGTYDHNHNNYGMCKRSI